MKKITIIIVTYNSLRLIHDCLQSIFEHNDIGENLEVLIVDNASDDQKEMFGLVKKEFGSQRVSLLDTCENGGYGKGNNYVMNPDVRFIYPVFSDIEKEFEDPKLGMAGVSFIDGSLPYYFKPEYTTFYRSFFIRRYIRDQKYDTQKMYMSGSLLIFNREAFIEAGQFDENIFMYYEEADITNRMQRTGWEVRWLKNMMVQHLAHGRKYNQKLIDFGYESYEYYCKKYNIDAKRGYRINSNILRLKIIAAWLVRDKARFDVFMNTLKSLNKHLKTL